METSRASNPVRLLPFRLFAVLAGVIGIGIVVVGLGTNAPSNVAPEALTMVEVAPGGVIDPADVPESVAVLYRAAHDHADLYAQVRCFCGCEAMLEHRHLLDCFVRPDGGWEAHGLGCGVCLGEAQQVEDLLAAGVQNPDDIRAAVVAQWGDPYQ